MKITLTKGAPCRGSSFFVEYACDVTIFAHYHAQANVRGWEKKTSSPWVSLADRFHNKIQDAPGNKLQM